MKFQLRLVSFFFFQFLLYGNFYAIHSSSAQETKQTNSKVDTIFSKLVEEESQLSFLIAEELNITEPSLSVKKSLFIVKENIFPRKVCCSLPAKFKERDSGLEKNDPTVE